MSNNTTNNIPTKEIDTGSEKAFNDIASDGSMISNNTFEGLNFDSAVKDRSLSPNNKASSPLSPNHPIEDSNSPVELKTTQDDPLKPSQDNSISAATKEQAGGAETPFENGTPSRNNTQLEHVVSAQFSKPFEYPSFINRKQSLPRDKVKNCVSIIKSLKHNPDAYLFLQPVDYKTLRLPDYPTIVKKPMDLSTVESKLNNCVYETTDEFISDVNLIFKNCYLYNGVDSFPSRQAKNLETEFKKLLKKQQQTSQKPVYHVAEDMRKMKGGKGKTYRPVSKSTHTSHNNFKRPKPHSSSKTNEQQLKYCATILKELTKKNHHAYSFPFLQPVDWVTLNIPDYPQIVKTPMDMGTIKKKLEANKYIKASEFEDDVKLMFNNCYLYNPPTNPVHMMGKKFEEVFNRKWEQRPQSPPPSRVEDGLSSDDNDAISDKDREITMLKKKLSAMRRECETLRANQQKDNSNNVSRAKQTDIKAQMKSKKRPAAPPVQQIKKEEYPTVTLEQKKELSEKYFHLNESQIEKMFEIIKSGMPHLQAVNDEDEIELDIDSLDKKTLWKLYDYVINTCVKKNGQQKRSASIAGHEEDNQIAELEKKLKKFENVDKGTYNKQENDVQTTDHHNNGGADHQ